MCQQKFGVVLKTTISCIDSGKDISLSIKRKGLPVIIPIGTHIIFGEYNFEVIRISAPLSFDVITYECDIYETLTDEQITELIIKYKWWKE